MTAITLHARLDGMGGAKLEMRDAGAMAHARASVSKPPDAARTARPQFDPGRIFVGNASLVRPSSPPRDGQLLVDGSAGAGQMTKHAFLEQVRAGLHDALEQELAGTDWTSTNCPWLEYWLSYYEARSAFDVEAALRKYAVAAQTAREASEYIPAVITQIRASVAGWRATATIDFSEAQAPSSLDVLADLGPGKSLESPVRSRMEAAFGVDLAGTRVHADGTAARLASQQGARAFAIGSHIAFAAGEYEPGTRVGDAILAHELAHTMQQRDASIESTTPTSSGLEHDADRTAIGVLGRLWRGVRSAVAPVARTGLQLQRCTRGKLPDPAQGNVPDYDAFSDQQGHCATTDDQALAWAAMFKNPDELDQVFADAAGGNARAQQVVAELHQFFTVAGETIAEKENEPDCLIPAWRELKGEVMVGCIPDWSYFDFLHADRPGGEALREDIAKAYSARSRELGIRNSIIVNALNIFMAGWEAKAVLADEARALDVSPPEAPKAPPRVKIPADVADVPAADAAKAAGLPDTPDGYHWSKANDGTFTVKRNPVQGGDNPRPQLRYDPDTRSFVEAKDVVPPKPAVVSPSTPPPELKAAAEDAVAARDALPEVGKKTVARGADGTQLTSGWGSDVSRLDPVADLAKKIGYEPKPNPKLDAPGKPGSYNLSHAEKQVAAATNGDVSIGVSREMCMDCQTFFQKLATYKGKPVVVADPAGIRVFYPDGSVVSATTVAGLVGAAAASSNTKGQVH